MRKDKIIGHAYGRLVEENNQLKKALADIQRERASTAISNQFKELAEKIRSVIGKPVVEVVADGDLVECQCDLCKAERAATAAVKRAEAPPNATEPAVYQTTAKVTPATFKNIHPWDAEWPTRENPLGMTARQLMQEKDERIAGLEKLLSEVRGKNTELEARIQGQHPLTQAVVYYQSDVVKEVTRLWGANALTSNQERVQRFAEEAAELVQACGLDMVQFGNIVSWVYSRPPGPKPREVGGTLVTLAALCHTFRMDMLGCGLAELQRLQGKEPEEMQGRHKAKPMSIRTV